MKIWIDGHNLIPVLPDISLEDPDDEAKLVLLLQRYVWRTNHTAVVYFDRGRGGGTLMPQTEVKVHFAAEGQTADELIRQALDDLPPAHLKSVLLVTSDIALQHAASAAGVRVSSSQAFARRLIETLTPAPTPEAEPTLTPADDAELLEQFEARHQARQDRTSDQPRRPSQPVADAPDAADSQPAAGHADTGAPPPPPAEARPPARNKPKPTLTSEDQDLLGIFEARHEERKRTQPPPEPLPPLVKSQPRGPRGTPEPAPPAAPDPLAHLSPEDRELLRQLEAHQQERRQNPPPPPPDLPQRHPRAKPSEEESLLREFEARYRARKQRPPDAS